MKSDPDTAQTASASPIAAVTVADSDLVDVALRRREVGVAGEVAHVDERDRRVVLVVRRRTKRLDVNRVGWP
jgi:hypothetical protein